MFFPFIIPFPLCLPLPIPYRSRRNCTRYEIYQVPNQPVYVFPHPPPAYGGAVAVNYVTPPVQYVHVPPQPHIYTQYSTFKQDTKQLREMFPSLPKDVVKATLAAYAGNKQQAINALLEMNRSQ